MTKIGLIGCGGWGKNLARNLFELGVLSAIADPSEFAVNLAKDLGVPHFASPEAIFAISDIEGIAIATPAETHVPLGLAALEAGKHIYVEKPIALSTDDARVLAEKAAAMGRVLMVGHLLQYHPVYRALAEATGNGRFGEVHHLISNRMNLGMVRNEENVMWSFSPHDVSMVLGLAGSAPKRVRAVGSSFLQPEIDDIVTMFVAFEGGQTAEIRSSWLHPEKEQKLTLVGSKAMAVFDDRAVWTDKLIVTDYTIDRSNPRPKAVRLKDESITVEQGEPLRNEMSHFVACVADNARPLTDANEAIAVLSVLQAAQISLDGQGDWIDV